MVGANTISFARGAPSVDIVDVAGLKAAAARALDLDPAAVTGYGPAAGYRPLREWVAQRHGVEVDNVLLTNGSLQAAAFLFELVAHPGEDVVVERPTYDRTLRKLRAMGLKIHEIGVDQEGLQVDQLRALLESGLRPKLLHVIPNYQNPSGVTLSLPRRNALLDLAREYGFTIFEDDPYHDIRFRGPTLPTLLELAGDQAGRTVAKPVVVHAASFTKTVCPGVRVGYLVGPPATITTLTRRALDAYISPNMLAEVTVHQLCISGDMDRSVARVCTALTERMSLLASALRREIPTCAFLEPDGGYFLWVELAPEVDAERLVPLAAGRGVSVVSGRDFVLDGGHSSLRLAFSAVRVDQIDEGVRRLAGSVAEVVAGR